MALRRRLFVIIATTILAGAAAAGIAYINRNKYKSTAELLFNQSITSELNALGLIPPSPNADRLSADDAAFVRSQRNAVLAASMLGNGATAASVQKMIVVPTPQTSEVVQVIATADSRQRAAEVANAYVNATIVNARNDQATRTGLLVARLKTELAKDSRRDPTCRFWSTPSTIARLSGCETATATVVSTLKLDIAKVSAVGGTGQAFPQLIQPGYVPTTASSKPIETVVLGAALGLVLGVGLALLREQSDTRLRHPRALSDAFEAPVLATVPDSRALARRRPFGSLPPEVAAPFHMVLAHLRYGASPPVRSVLITSIGVRTTIAWNLAAAAAASGLSVLLIDTDLRRSALASQYGLQPSPGLSEVLRRELPAADAIQRVPIFEDGKANGQQRRVSLLPAGTPPPEPLLMLQSGDMTELLNSLRHYELVILDASPIAHQSDAISLLHRVDGVLIVAPLNSSRGPEAEELRSRLAALEANVIGVVAVGGGKRPGGYVAATRSAPTAQLQNGPDGLSQSASGTPRKR